MANAEPEDSRVASATVSFDGKRVVVVEDEGITQMQLAKILRRAGFTIVGAALNGETGVELALQERPDLILMDINMPGAYNGLEAVRRILADYNVCIVILTAYGDYIEEARQLGACGYIIKPLDEQSLLPQLRAALHKFQQGIPFG